MLTDTERRIFQTCLDTVLHFGLATTVRVAGGWVRDKLLGLQSDDIDITLDDHLGREFAARVNEFLDLQVSVREGALL
jgi:tRNA nucleotidyltransferase (CCA-adding enzyme)